MLTPPIPENEVERVAALRALNILDTPPEERFDRITRLARMLFHVPIALVSLVEENRQWFKSCQGLDISETSREVSFCAHTILQKELFIIPNALLDARFANNPLVIGEPYIRFYAGCPLYDLNGYALGSFCIIDSIPHLMSEQDQQALRDLGTWVEHEINTARISQAFIAQCESEARMRAIMESTSDALLLMSPDNYYLTVNQRFCDFFGISREDVLGKTTSITHTAAALKRIFPHTEQIKNLILDTVADNHQQFTTFVQQEWPVSRELELFSTAVYNNKNEHLGRLFMFRDVTREREIDRMKTEFASHVSHELRSPLTAIKGYIDLFVQGDAGELTPLQEHLLGIVQNNTDRLISLINDLLDLSRIEGGHLEVRRTLIELPSIIHNIVELLQPQFTAKQQTLTVQQQEPLAPILADAPRLTQVLTNILCNAHNYTPEGGSISITTHANEQYVSIDVQDNGIGLSRDEQANIFTKFYRAKNGVTAFTSGTGLGLTISRSIIEAHHGKIAVSSTPGVGSTFSVMLPTVAELRRRLILPESTGTDHALVGTDVSRPG